MLRIATFDIETTALEGSYGRVLCACFKFQDESKVRSFQAILPRDEKRALKGIREAYAELDIVVTWNGKLFDIPMMNARLMANDLETLPSKMHLDLLYQSKKLGFRGNRMEYVSKDLKTKTKKYDVPASDWVAAGGGDLSAHAEILKHCQQDVLLTEELCGRLKHLVVNITR